MLINELYELHYTKEQFIAYYHNVSLFGMKPLEDAEVIIVNRNYVLFDIRGVEDEIVNLPEYVNGLFNIEAYNNKNYFMTYSYVKNHIKEINFSQKLSIGRYALAFFKELESINGIISSIGVGAFKYCTSLKNLNLNRVKVLPDYSLRDCSSLLELNLKNVEVMQRYCISNSSNSIIMRIKARDLIEVKPINSRGVVLIDITECNNPIKVYRQNAATIFLQNGIILDWTGLPSINAKGECHLGKSRSYTSYDLGKLETSEEFAPREFSRSRPIFEDTPRVYFDAETNDYYSYLWRSICFSITGS